ncbi:MAG: response regulator transcription factor [Clostridiales bacterium]|nr:response regulator transcription factor [Clostridiales bacterium]
MYIVDDEPSIRRLLSAALEEEGYGTQAFSEGKALLAALRHTLPDLIILDWMMPEPDGLEVCRRLREDPATRPVPVLMLTARGQEDDRVTGLNMGADDYLSKPFSVRELTARVKALIRRGEYMSGRGERLRAGGLAMDLSSRQASLDGKPVELTAKEFDLLAVLLRHTGQVLTREQLLDAVWGMNYGGEARTVDVHIRFLRQKLEGGENLARYIHTLRGVGYRLSPPEDGRP